MNGRKLTGRQIKVRREALGLSQRELSRESGVPQPSIAAAESGTREQSKNADQRLRKHLAVYPYQLLDLLEADAKDLFSEFGIDNLRVFGSVARGEDTPTSDIDFLVTVPRGTGIFAVARLKEQLEELFTIPVDVVSDDSAGPVFDQAIREAVPL